MQPNDETHYHARQEYRVTATRVAIKSASRLQINRLLWIHQCITPVARSSENWKLSRAFE